MKKITFNILKFSILLIIIVSACKKDDGLKLNEPSHRVVFTSEMDFENKIEVHGEISFGDVSPGVESRTWTFPAGVVDIIDSDDDNTSTEANVKTVFNQIGVFEVNLKQTFKEDAFVGNSQQGRNLDTNIIVTVLDSITVQLEGNYINPDGTIGAALDFSNNAENEIPAARSVRLRWIGDGEPRIISWDFERADPTTFVSMDSTIDVKYKFLGTFDLMVIGSRSRPFGVDTLFLENFMKVVPSTDPVVVEEVTDQDGHIAVVFSRELEAATLEATDFSISVYNDGGLITDNFTNISLDPVDGNIVLIDLGGETIYNDDSISVSFTDGTLISTDGVLADPFSDGLLAFQKENILATNSNFDYGFETSSSSNWVFPTGWNAEWGLYTMNITSDNVYEGNNSAYIEIEANGNMVLQQNDLSDMPVQFPANATKTYEIGSWIYLEDIGSTDPADLQPDLRFYWQPAFPNALPNPEFNADFPLNEWVYRSAFVNFDETGNFHFQIRGFNQANPEVLKFYLDNITLAEVELRP